MTTQGVDSVVAQIRSRTEVLLHADLQAGNARPRDYYLDMALSEIQIGDPRLQPCPQLRTDSILLPNHRHR
ncbi:hypothetical protein IT409_02205 [Candidatus Falkowbacteria bacterium]|nr:hypothetical protein [Candidatus Falkowbacteria bacterium]